MIGIETAKLLQNGKKLLNEKNHQLISYKNQRVVIDHYVNNGIITDPNIAKISDNEFNDLVDRYLKKELYELIGQQQELTLWQKHLIEEYYLFPDGKRVKKGYLNDAVYEYVTFTKTKITWRFVQETFIQENYRNYCKRYCEEAVAYSNEKPVTK